MKNLNKYTSAIITTATIIGLLFGAFTYISAFEQRDVLFAQEIQEVKKDVEYLKLQKLYDEARGEYYSVKSLLKKYPQDEELQEQIKDTQENVSLLKERLQRLKD